ncbi:hypothetical protein NKR23_g10945 [Pleurostoma richardsiae]|uniref:DUF7924 domain-containing protein n=1 Tax=Pleurostoma richardsiae TaxID=41990 RepID=A0AA38VBN7_9PEZI|nr:hypothetical protein NKR23_g10945 [Pleurostoma richardsiae]
MGYRVSKAQLRRPRMNPSQFLQEQLLNAVAGEGTEHPPNEGVPSPTTALQDVPAQSRKRRLDETDDSAAKRPRISTEAEEGEEGEESQPADKTTIIQHPKPKPPRAAFLERLVEPFEPSPRSPSHRFISEWLESLGSGRDTRSRSDSYLSQPVSEPISRRLAKSAPQMGYTRDADGFAVPPTPASTRSRSRADSDGVSVAPSDVTGFTLSSSRASGRSLVEDPLYRDMNLAANNIYMRPLREQFPSEVADLVNYVRRDRDSPGPSQEEVWQDAELNELWIGAGEPKVEDYFKDKIFPKSRPGDVLDHSDRQPMARHTVPNAGSKLRVSNPVPDMLYGYNRQAAFPQQQAQLISMGTEMVANNQYNGLLYPFFIIEFKGDSGSMWVATNQCLGGSASCVNVAERLNHQLEQCKSDEIRPISSAAFSIAMSGSEARLYISWKHNELDYYMANIDSFLLQKPKDYIEFRKYVRNIIDWGRDKRLNEIRSSLDTLLEESRKKASEAAKSRPPPSDGSDICGGKKRKSSSSRRNSSTSRSTQQSEDIGVSNAYWQWDETIRRYFHRNDDGTLSWAEDEGQSSYGAAT